MLADDARNPSTFGDSIGFGCLLDKRLRGVIQIQGDLRHIHPFEKVYVEVYVDSWPVCKPAQALPTAFWLADNFHALIA
jgi:hypothetical protein